MKHAFHLFQLSFTVVVILSLLFPATALAASGDLDTTFSADGKVMTTFTAGLASRAWDVAIQQDGKVVVVGDVEGATTDMNIGIVRYTTNGALDKTFNLTGKKTIDIAGNFDQGLGLAISPEGGKIIVVGQTCSGGGAECDLVIGRLTSKGVLDTTFNTSGIRVDDFGGGDNGSFGAVAIQEDGKIVVGGYMYNTTTSNYDFAIHRYTTTGKLDKTFNGTGKKSVPISAGRNDAINGLAIQDDGRIVAVGQSCDSNTENCNVAMVRLTSTGALDTSFNTTGKVVTNLGGDDFGYDVAIQSDGKIVVAGKKGAADTNFVVLRYTTAGKLDTTFAGTGKKVFDFSGAGEEDYARAVEIQADGKIVAAGYANGDFALVRLTKTGAIDTSFSIDGKASVEFGENDRANGIAIQPADGKYVLAGNSNGAIQKWAVARLLP